MTTTIAGGRITSRIALTGQAQSALTFNTPVRIVGDYEFDVANATTRCIGFVITPNVARGTGSLSGTYPQAQVPGDVSVETWGAGVAVVPAGPGGVAAGNEISVDATGNYIVGAHGDVNHVGVALTTAAAGSNFDLLEI